MLTIYDAIVVGGGLIGLATARALLMRKPRARVIVLEKEAALARHQSGRNSGVVHAGLYYPPGSLKAKLCRDGRAELLQFAEQRGIAYDVCGKLVVALDQRELDRLNELRRRGEGNGLVGLRELDSTAMRGIEPHVRGFRALHVPETAVIDFAAVTRAYAEDVRERGGEVRMGAHVTALTGRSRWSEATTSAGETFAGAHLIACAGLQSDRLAAGAMHDRRIAPFRGDFTRLAPRAAALVRGLIYPVPDPAFPFLGVHFTRRIDGEVWAGPNAVPALARERYGRAEFDARDARDFLGFPGTWRVFARYSATGARELWRAASSRAALKDMRRYLPELELRDLERGPSGVRAQVLTRAGDLVDDFLIERSGDAMHVVNAPSPAATASLAIGRMIADRLDGWSG